MKRSRYSDEQNAYALRQAEAGTAVADVCRQLGISESTFYVWKKRIGHMAVAEVRELRQLREENAKLKRLMAALSLDKSILTEIVRKTPKAGNRTRTRDVGAGHVPSGGIARVPAVDDFEGVVVLP
jgi:putative transposase